MKIINLQGLKIHKTSYADLHAHIINLINNNDKAWIATPNPEIWLKARSDINYLNIINQANVVIADGFGLTVASYYDYLRNNFKFFNFHVIGRLLLWKLSIMHNIFCLRDTNRHLTQISGDILFKNLILLSNKYNWKIFLLGGQSDSARMATKKIIKEYGLNVDYHPGVKNIQHESESERLEIINQINIFKPHLIFVAYGAPDQEKWIFKNLSSLKVNLAIGVGGTIDEYANNIITPNFFRKNGLRWLWRLYKQPQRIKRVYNAIVIFSWKYISEG